MRYSSTRFPLYCLLLMLAASVVLSRPAAPAGGAAEKDGDVYRSLDILCDVITIIQRDYIEKLGTERLMQDALRGMLASLDSYSTYLPAPAPRATPGPPAGEPGTYGLEVAYKNRLLTVVSTVENGPAWKAGLKSGDLIIKIGEEPVDDRPLAELLQLFRGAAAGELRLQVARRGEREFLDFTLAPGKVEGPAARTEMPEDKIALLRIARFDRGTPARVAECLAALKERGADGTVLDLRDCPAGEIEAAIEVAGHFISEGGLVATLAARSDEARKEFVSSGAQPSAEGPVVILVNGGTSGAAEVLAGALQAEGRGVLMGQKSFGCAFEEGTFTLKDGSVITLLTAVYRTPAGAEIQDKGLTPDIEVVSETAETEAGEGEGGEGEGEEFEIPDEKGEKGLKGVKAPKGEQETDPVVQRAIDLIKGMRIMKSKEGN